MRTRERYEEILEESNALDFDDLLIQAVRVLEDSGEALDAWRRRFTHVLVDEFQDTNWHQYRLARLLTEKSRNLCVTGDPDQSIYTWRGADPRNFDDFQADYPEAPRGRARAELPLDRRDPPMREQRDGPGGRADPQGRSGASSAKESPSWSSGSASDREEAAEIATTSIQKWRARGRVRRPRDVAIMFRDQRAHAAVRARAARPRRPLPRRRRPELLPAGPR